MDGGFEGGRGDLSDRLLVHGETKLVARLSAPPTRLEPRRRNPIFPNGIMSSLHFASRRGDLRRVLVFLDQGADINGKDNYRSTPLIYAVDAGHLEIVKVLLDRGADINLQAEHEAHDGMPTPLYLASLRGHLEIVKVLLDRGADNILSMDIVGRISLSDCKPLHVAAFWGHLNVVQLLVDRGAEINLQAGRGGPTALDLASECGRLEIVKVLLDRGAEMSVQDKQGTIPRPLCGAAAHGHSQVFHFLLDRTGADINLQSMEDGRTLLHCAASSELVRFLLDRGADINVQDKKGDTPVHIAARTGKRQVVQVLLDRGAEVNLQNEKGNSPLHGATEDVVFSSYILEVVQSLLDGGADINVQNIHGTSPLHRAAWNARSDVVQLLLDRGADVNVKDKNGNTPLHLAANAREASDGRSLAVVQVLLDGGADINLQNNYGMSPLHFAAGNAFWLSVQLLLDRGADINVQNNYGDTPLLQIASAASNGSGRHLEIVQLLLDRGADINVNNNDGNTPLLQAANGRFPRFPRGGPGRFGSRLGGLLQPGNGRPRGRMEVVQVLLDGGAAINVQNNNGMSPLHNAASDGHLEIVHVLLERGADINVKNNDGDTPLISAAIGAAAIHARLESSRVQNNEHIFRFLEVVRVLLLVWMFGIRPSLVVGPSV